MKSDSPPIVGRGGRKKIGDNESKKIDYSPLNMTESSDDKLARLKGEAGEMMKERIASTVVNAFADNTTQTSVAVNPTVPKSTSADALALNPTG